MLNAAPTSTTRENEWNLRCIGFVCGGTATKRKKPSDSSSTQDLNVQLAWYAAAIVVGVVGATYASVPLYKVFCQTTGFGGTTQRVQTGNEEPPTWVEKMLKSAIQQLPQSAVRKARVHTWTDEDAAARLSTLRPVANAELITVHFDTTIGDVMPWSFEATQPNVKVVPGETALSFFRVINHSDKAITGGMLLGPVYTASLVLFFKDDCA